MLKLVGRHDTLTLPTGAAVSPDGQHLAVLSYTHLWVFSKPRRGDRWLDAPAKVLELDRKVVKQNEAITWENDNSLILSNENRDLFRVPLDDLSEPPSTARSTQ